MNLDKFFNKTYHEKDYNCLHFASEVWKEITGKDFTDLIASLINNELNKNYKFEILDKPIPPCIVVMKRLKCRSHVGIYFEKRVIHLTELGVECYDLNIATRGFNKLRFIR